MRHKLLTTNKRGISVFVSLISLMLVLPLGAQVDRIDRERMRDVLKTVSSDIQKNFYDSNLKGLDWRTLTDQARSKIDNAKSMSEMIAAIFVLANKLDDSHTQFLPPGRASRPIFGFMAKPFGDELRIYAEQTKGPAAQAGLKVGDRLLSVNGYTAERSTYDLMMLDFHALRPKSELAISYVRGSEPPKTIYLKARIIKDVRSLDPNTTLWRYLSEWSDDVFIYHWKVFDDDIAYLEIPTFDANELTQPHRLEKMPRAMLIDLRGNGGGSQSALLEFAGHFEPTETSMGNSMQRKKTEALKIRRQKPNFGSVPLVVMIDSETGSAAEMLARHLQLSRKATIIGDRSSGRVNGSKFFVEGTGGESVIPFGIQISVAKIVLANDEELEKRGVMPDVVCLPGGDDLRDGNDPCLARALALARKASGLTETLPITTQTGLKLLVTGMRSDYQKEYDRERP